MNSQTRIKRYFAKARQASLMSDYHKEHIGAVLVYSNSILATGFNTLKTTPVQKEYNLERGINDDNVNNGACHAEMMCLLKTKYLDIDWSKAKMYIYRENKKYHYPMAAKPCKACAKALKDRGITQVFYTTNEVPYRKL